MEFEATQAIDITLSDEDVPEQSKSREKMPVAQLKVTAYEGQGEQLHKLYRGENVIGRRSESHITIPAKTISKKHAIIDITEDVHMIHDLGSVNKTRRGKIVLKANVRYELQNGDVLRFGDVTCIYTKTAMVIASDSDTDTECLINDVIEASDSDSTSHQTIKKTLKPINSNNEAKPSTASAQETLELNNNASRSKQTPPEELEPVAARRKHNVDFMRTGLILSDSECSESDEEPTAASTPPKIHVPETPAGELMQTTSSMLGSSPGIGHKRFNMGRLISSSDSDTDIEDKIKLAENSTESKKEISVNSTVAAKCVDSSEEISELLNAETQLYAKKASQSSIDSELPAPHEKQAAISGVMKTQPTIVRVDDNIDWFELATQPNPCNGSCDAEDEDEEAAVNTSGSGKSTDGKRAEEEVVEESDWASMATQPYIIGKATKCMEDPNEEVDIFNKATQIYPAERIVKTTEELCKEDGSIEDVNLADTVAFAPIAETKASTEKNVDMQDLALADTLPIELIECEGATSNDDKEARGLESEETIFTSPQCTDEETINLKEKIAEVLTSPALALSQEIQGDSAECVEYASVPVSDQKDLGESPVPRKDDEGSKTDVAKRKAPPGRMSTRRRKNALELDDAEADRKYVGDTTSSAFRPYRKIRDEEGPSASPTIEPKGKTAKPDLVSKIKETGKLKPAELPDKAAESNIRESKDPLAGDAGDSKHRSPAVIGPTPPSGPRSRRSTASKYRRTPEIPESDSSDNSCGMTKRRRALHGSAFKKAAAAEMLPKDVKLPASETSKKRATLQFDSSDDDTNTDELEGERSVNPGEDASTTRTEKPAEKMSPITESQWQRLEEEIAELSGEGSTVRSPAKTVDGKSPGDSTNDVSSAVKDSTDAGTAPTAMESKDAELQVSKVETAEEKISPKRTAESPRRGRSAATSTKRSEAKKSPKAAKCELLTDGGSEPVEKAQEKKRGRPSGLSKKASRLQNLKGPKSQPQTAQESSDVEEPQDNKRVSWSQEVDPAEDKQTQGKTKAKRAGRRTKTNTLEELEASKQPEEKDGGSCSADEKAAEENAAEENEKGRKTKKERKKSSAVEETAAAEAAEDGDTKLPSQRSQRTTKSMYRRLVTTTDSAIDTSTTEYESESSPARKAAPAKQAFAAKPRGRKAKTEVDEGAAQETPEVIVRKSYPKRGAPEQAETTPKRRKGPKTVNEPATGDAEPTESVSSKPGAKRAVTPSPAVTKRSRISKSEPKPDSDTESMDEFETKAISPALSSKRKATGTAARKTPQKKGAATPEPASRATPRRSKGSPRVQPNDEAVPRIMFTGISEKSLEKIVKNLNGILVDSVFECTHLVTDKVRRTWKFLCMLARGCHIVSPAWLKQCKAENSFIDATPYVISDESAEKQYKFKLRESLTRARNESFLKGYRIHATKNVKPPPQEMQTIIKCAGGTYLARMPTSGTDVVVVTCPEDVHLCAKARKGGVAVVGTEFILTGVLRHVVEIGLYRC